jgi:hypothetical protein
MRKLLVWALHHPGRVTIFALSVLRVFVVTIAALDPCGFSFESIGRSTDIALTLLLAIDSPSKLLHNPSLIVFGWLACLMGWLFLPLGMLVDTSVTRAESYSELEVLFRELGHSSDLDRFS